MSACLTLSAVCGKLIVGFLADRYDIRKLMGVIILLSCCATGGDDYSTGITGYWWLLPPCLGLLWVVCIRYGWGLQPKSLVPEAMAQLMGMMLVVMQPLSIFALRLIGEARDRFGNYDIGFWGSHTGGDCGLLFCGNGVIFRQ